MLVPLLALIASGFGRRGRAILAIIAATLSGFAVAQIWVSPAAQLDPGFEIQPAQRLSAALHHPLVFALAFLGDWRESLVIRLTEMVGTLGWLDAPMPLPFVVIALSGIALVATDDGPAWKDFRGLRRFIPWLLFAGTVAGITIATHLCSPAPKFALAIQGRYFLPALPLAFLPLMANHQPRKWTARIAGGLVVLFAAQTIFTELLRFYV